MKTYRYALGVLLLLGMMGAAAGQEDAGGSALQTERGVSGGHRLRIGLVLEGGGALGLAHVGVIRWLEENHVPVDVVAGTSMGGLVGGIYASGKTPDEIEGLIASIKWNKVLGGATPYRDLAFRRKEDKREYQNALEFGLKNGNLLPSGFNSGQQVGLILDQVGLPYSEMKTFDDLPIPFRCVATDLVSGQKFVFEKGSLAEAMRATMSLPGFFVPVRDGHAVLVDGGLLNNLPVDLARAMGAEIVIAVNLRTAALDPKKSLSSVDVLGRSASLMVSVNELASIASLSSADILLTADVTKFSSSDYAKFKEIEPQGYDAAKAKRALLLTLRVQEDEWRQILAARASRERRPDPPQFVQVQGAEGEVKTGLERELSSVPKAGLNEKALGEKMMEITGLGRFAKAGYREKTEGGRTGLLVQTQEKEYAPPTVHPQLVIDGSDYKNVLFEVGGRITYLDLAGFGSEWRNDFVGGSEYGFKTEFFHPFNSYTGWFVAAHGTADSSPFNVYQRDRILGEFRDRRFGGGVDVGYIIGRSAEMRVGYEAGYQKISEEIGEPVAPTVRGRYGFGAARFRLDRFDDPTIPRQGVRLDSTFRLYDGKPGTPDAVTTGEAKLGLAQRICKETADEEQTGQTKRACEKMSALFFASGGTSFRSRDLGFPAFSLGGPLRLGAYGTNELLTNQYFLVQPAVLYKLWEISPILKQNVYLLGMYEAGKAFGPAGGGTVAQDGTAGVLLQTVFGPIFFGGSAGDRDHRKFFFKVGHFF